MKPPPSGRALEIALQALLCENNFNGTEDINVFVVGPKLLPIYILTLSPDVARALADLLAPVLGKRTQPSATEWVLFRADADAILKTAA
jgi:hypothetical protein